MELHNNFHCFDKGAAKQCGVNGALLLWNFRYWIDENIANNRNFHDGRYWTYQSMDALCKTFDYLTANQIRTAIDKLVKGGYIVKGNYNKSSYDHTTWYSITEAGYAVFSDFCGKNATFKNHNSICEKTQIEAGIFPNRDGLQPKSIRGTYNIPYDSTNNIPPNPPMGGMGETADADSEFDRFWAEYPRKQGKGAALKAYRKARKKITAEEMLSAVRRQKTSWDWTKDGGQYVPQPATWLNQERWSDELRDSPPPKDDADDWHNDPAYQGII